jgi:hypothetical protein
MKNRIDQILVLRAKNDLLKNEYVNKWELLGA